MKSHRALICALLLLSLFVAGCGAAARDAGQGSGQPVKTVREYGLRIDLAAGWHGEVVRPEPPAALTLRAATFPLPPATDVGQRAQRTMGERDTLITLAYYGRARDDSGIRRATLPLEIERADFAPFEGFTRPVATDAFVLDGGAFQLWAVFRDDAPSDEVFAQANRLLATIALEPRRLALGGLSIELPVGWDGYAKHLSPYDEAPSVYAANVPWPDVGQNVERPAVRELFERLPRDGVVISAVSSWNAADRVARALVPPIELADGYFLADSYEGQPAPHVSTQLIFGRIGDRFLNVQVLFGRNDPDEAMRAEANAVLATLTVTGRPAAPAPAGWRKHHAPELGVRATVPDSWHLAREPLTSSVDPRQVLALATYPLAGGGNNGGPCVAAKRAVDAMPADGALIWLLEYRPARGDVWADLPRGRFPPRPDGYTLTRTDLQRNLCGTPLGLSTTFREADRPFQLWLFFGAKVSDALLAEVAQILTGLSFDDLPAPPPDPYAGWPLINTNPGDSLRPPPGWASAAAMFPPDKTPRPRPLFFASNQPLFGLPHKLVPHVDALPGPMPDAAVANQFPKDGVLLWVVEESDAWQIGENFPPIDRNWPRSDDFRPAEVLTKPAPELRWLHAGGEWRGYRFSVWIASGPDASQQDRQLALKSAASLAVSGCGRDRIDDCPDG
jgi:predicted small secreted protein